MNMMNPSSHPLPLTPLQGFTLGWIRYAEFHGRSSRMEFWSFQIITFFLQFLLSLVSLGILGVIFQLVVLVPSFSVWVRRLHDTGRSGLWVLWVAAAVFPAFFILRAESIAGVIFLFLAAIAMLLIPYIMCFADGDPETNQYGPNPKLNPTNPSHPV